MTPTNKLRWVRRDVFYKAPEEVGGATLEIEVLQQWWSNPSFGMYEGKLNDDGSLSEVRQINDPGEWRDVPIEEEK